MSADSLLPVVLPEDAGAARPLRRAAGFFLVAVALPLVAYLMSVVAGAQVPLYAAGVTLMLAIPLAIMGAVHILAGLMIWLGSPRHAR